MRERTPIADLELQNSKNLRRALKRAAVEFDKSVKPEPPNFLDDLGRAEWRRLADDLFERGLLYPATATVFAALCEATSTYQHAVNQIREEGHTVCEPIVVRGAVVGEKVRNHPAFRRMFEARKAIVRLSAEFGLSPATASRVESKSAKENTGADFAEFMGKHEVN